MSNGFLSSYRFSGKDALAAAALSRQVAAIPVSFGPDHSCRVLMVTTKKSRKWIVPKGWHIPGLSGFEAAAREAYEEAGVRGIISQRPIGQYDYVKTRPNRPDLDCRVDVYLLHVREQLDTWPESSKRLREWVSLPEAAKRAGHRQLGELLGRSGHLFTDIVHA